MILIKREYILAVEEIVAALSPNKKPKPQWIQKEKRLNGNIRMKPGSGNLRSSWRSFFHAHDEKIINSLESGNFNFIEINAMLEGAANSLVDLGIEARGMTSLGLSPGFPKLYPSSAKNECVKFLGPPYRLDLAR